MQNRARERCAWLLTRPQSVKRGGSPCAARIPFPLCLQSLAVETAQSYEAIWRHVYYLRVVALHFDLDTHKGGFEMDSIPLPITFSHFPTLTGGHRQPRPPAPFTSCQIGERLIDRNSGSAKNMELYFIAALILVLVAVMAIISHGAKQARTLYDSQTRERREIIQELSREGLGFHYMAMFLNRAGFRNREGNEFTEEQVELELSRAYFARQYDSTRIHDQ